jgi:hypothetical protein
MSFFVTNHVVNSVYIIWRAATVVASYNKLSKAYILVTPPPQSWFNPEFTIKHITHQLRVHSIRLHMNTDIQNIVLLTK